MKLDLLKKELRGFQTDLESAIKTGVYGTKRYPNGHQAKEAMIRGSGLIFRIHHVVKCSLAEELTARNRPHRMYPPLGKTAPELKITGFIKAKKQDVVVLTGGDKEESEAITEGPLTGEIDSVGRASSERSIVVGVRSQMSSVAKNFDTLMERAFAEALNLRLRLPRLVLGEVYVLPLYEYDDVAMRDNEVAFKSRPVAVDKFIRTFAAISGRGASAQDGELYKYERTALVLVDFKSNPMRVITRADDLRVHGFSPERAEACSKLLPDRFAHDLVTIHGERWRTKL